MHCLDGPAFLDESPFGAEDEVSIALLAAKEADNGTIVPVFFRGLIF